MHEFDSGSVLGPRVRKVREERGLSVRELARRVGCSASLISQIERGISTPSAGTVYGLAVELGASLDYLFDAMPAPGNGQLGASPPGMLRGVPPAGGLPETAAVPDGHGIVQRATTRRAIDLASGVRWERLTPCSDQQVDFLEVIYEPGGHSIDSRRPVRHDGYEYGLIISGALQAIVGFEHYELRAGDSIAFPATTPHHYWNKTGDKVHAISVVVHSEPGLA
ncbi:MAG TPA: XRE family transcriptional regulator [Streptosporangiaceae bacterium]|nr:XRE family transcriptional regulator [Streptosporangiaceae bacterium]